MKKFICLSVLIFSISAGVSAQVSVSLSPLTALLLLVFTDGNDADISDWSWFILDVNFGDDDRQWSIGINITPVTKGAKVRWRNYFGSDGDGFFLGLFGNIEYKKMIWYYYDDYGLVVNWPLGISLDNTIEDHVFHSFGATLGGELGGRFKFGRWGLTVFAGAGIPLYYSWGDKMPPDDEWFKFYLANLPFRAIKLGLTIDFHIE